MANSFNGKDYISQQSQVLLDYFKTGKKLLEINGEFLHDEFLTKILPGYEKYSQATILKNLFTLYPDITLIYCISAKDIVRDKQFSQKYLSFEKYILKELALISSLLNIKAQVIITLMDDDFIPPHAKELKEILQNQGYLTEFYSLGTQYKINHEKTLICSYDTKTGKSLLCQSIKEDFSVWSTLPLGGQDQYHPLNIIAKAYHYNQQNHNISIIEEYILNLGNEYYKPSCIIAIEDRITLYNKLLLSGYSEEEEIEGLTNLLIYLKN